MNVLVTVGVTLFMGQSQSAVSPGSVQSQIFKVPPTSTRQ